MGYIVLCQAVLKYVFNDSYTFVLFKRMLCSYCELFWGAIITSVLVLDQQKIPPVDGDFEPLEGSKGSSMGMVLF